MQWKKKMIMLCYLIFFQQVIMQPNWKGTIRRFSGYLWSSTVGLMAAHSAAIKGASKIMVVDNQKDRLKLAEELGAIAIDYSKGSAVEQVLELTDGKGADKGCK